MAEGGIIRFGNPENPQIAMDLPESVWQSLQTLLASERELYPDESDEYRQWTAIINLIRDKTGIEPEWGKIL